MSGLLEGKRIFISEDDPMNMAVFTLNLQKQGADIIQDMFTIGTIVFIAQSLPLDLILMDIMLRKGISGYDLFDQIRANPKLAHIPIVAVTSLDPEIEIPRAKGKGFDGFIGKPIVSYEIANYAARVINGEKLWIASR